MLRAYPRETVVAEKIEAMVSLEMANSRMKDFFDLLTIARKFPFNGVLLCEAIRATFNRRGTDIPREIPIALTTAFAQNESKHKQWIAFARRSGLEGSSLGLDDVVDELALFLAEPLTAASLNRDFEQHWQPGGPWRPEKK